MLDQHKTENKILLIRQLLSEGKALKPAQVDMLIEILTNILEYGQYKIQKKRGGQNKKSNIKELMVAYFVFKEIQKGATVGAAFLSASIYGVSSESAREYYYEQKPEIENCLKSDHELFTTYYDLLLYTYSKQMGIQIEC